MLVGRGWRGKRGGRVAIWGFRPMLLGQGLGGLRGGTLILFFLLSLRNRVALWFCGVGCWMFGCLQIISGDLRMWMPGKACLVKNGICTNSSSRVINKTVVRYDYLVGC